MISSQRSSRASSPSRSRNRSSRTLDYHDAAIEDEDIFGFIRYFGDFISPYLERAIALAHRYRIFDLVTYVFEEKRGEGEDEDPIDPEKDPEILKSMEKCTHPAHGQMKKGFLTNEIPVSYFSDLMEKEHKETKDGTVAMVHCKMNDIYVKRLLQIQSKAPRNTAVKLVTYQEWVDMLLKLNKSLLKNTREIESTIVDRFKEIDEVENRVKKDLDDSRHDFLTLIEFIRTAFYKGQWNREELNQLRTVSASSVLGENEEELRQS